MLDAPTLFESGADRECDYVVSVIADEQSRKERIIRRDGLTQQEAQERISAQHDEEYYKSRSDEILENNEGVDSLKNRTSALISRLESRMEECAQQETL